MSPKLRVSAQEDAAAARAQCKAAQESAVAARALAEEAERTADVAARDCELHRKQVHHVIHRQSATTSSAAGVACYC